jgi:hypothetical protein
MLIVAAMSLGVSGCGESADAPSKAGAAKPAAPPPRPGEDAMKEQMLRLQQKGVLSKVPGVPKAK